MSPDKHSRLVSAVIATIAGAGLTSSIASAADRNWINTQPNALWNTAGNWSPTGVPGAGDVASIINRTSTFQTITYDAPVGISPVLSRLTLNAESTGDLRFVMPADRFTSLRTGITSIGSTDVVTFRQESTLHEVGTMFQLGFGGTNGKATYELLGNGTTLNNLGESFIGGGGRAEFIQQGNVGHHVNLGLYISSFDQNTQNIYQMNGGSLTAGQLWVGEYGNGSFSHIGGMVDAGSKLAIAGKPNSIGYYDMWQGTTLHASFAEVGREGNGTLNQRGGWANFTQLYVGGVPGAWGTYNIGFGSLTTSYSVVGVTGHATMFNDRGSHTTGSLMIARDQGSNASYFLGHGATLTINQDLIVGGNGTGAFNQNGGANSIGRDLVIAQSPGAHGSVGLTFGTLTAQGGSVGYGGAGTMTIDGAAATFSASVVLGGSASGIGRANVASGSLTSNYISVGERGVGTFVQTGGNVRANTSLFVGTGTLANGTYTLSGGTLQTTHSFVGLHGRGVFTQTGGTHAVADRFATRAYTSAIGTYSMQGGSFSASQFENYGAWSQSGGNARAGLVLGGGQLHVGGGTFTADRFNYNGQTFVTGGGTLRIDDGPGNTTPASTMRFLEITGSGRLDLTDKGLVVDYLPTDVNPMPALAQHVRNAFAGGTWNGPGIGSSQTTPDHGVGFAPGTVPAAGGPFASVSFDATSARFAVVRYGDTNLDGTVNLTDFNALAANFGQTGRGWWQGDFNYDGIVNLADFNRLAGNFGLSAGPDGPTPDDWAILGSAVPEPAALAGTLGLMPLLMRRRRSV